MDALNEAFKRLGSHVDVNTDSDSIFSGSGDGGGSGCVQRKLSKFKIVKLALRYIRNMTEVLQEDTSNPPPEYTFS